jgi:hypothetical protein
LNAFLEENPDKHNVVMLEALGFQDQLGGSNGQNSISIPVADLVTTIRDSAGENGPPFIAGGACEMKAGCADCPDAIGAPDGSSIWRPSIKG